MNASAHRPSALLATTFLAGAVALGACGEVDRRPPAATAEPAPPAAEPAPAPADPAPEEDLALEAADRPLAAERAERLRALRQQYPTAGLEVPPASLRAGATTPSATAVVEVDDQEQWVVEPADRFTRYVQ